jgi:hypothetical protein
MSVRKAIQGHGSLQRYDAFLKDEKERIEQMEKKMDPTTKNVFRTLVNLMKIFRR